MSAQGLPCPTSRHGSYDLPCPHGSLESCCLLGGCKVYEYADEILSLLHITVVIRYSLPLANFFSKSVGRRFPLTTAFYFHPLPNSHSCCSPYYFCCDAANLRALHSCVDCRYIRIDPVLSLAWEHCPSWIATLLR